MNCTCRSRAIQMVMGDTRLTPSTWARSAAAPRPNGPQLRRLRLRRAMLLMKLRRRNGTSIAAKLVAENGKSPDRIGAPPSLCANWRMAKTLAQMILPKTRSRRHGMENRRPADSQGRRRAISSPVGTSTHPIWRCRDALWQSAAAARRSAQRSSSCDSARRKECRASSSCTKANSSASPRRSELTAERALAAIKAEWKSVRNLRARAFRLPEDNAERRRAKNRVSPAAR